MWNPDDPTAPGQDELATLQKAREDLHPQPGREKKIGPYRHWASTLEPGEATLEKKEGVPAWRRRQEKQSAKEL